MSAKRCSGFFLFRLRSCVIETLGFCESVEPRSFQISANNSRSKQSKKNPEHLFVDIGNVCKISRKYIKLYGS